MSVDIDRVADALPSYEITHELGRGAWGVVLAGRHRQLERDVAVKRLLPALAADVAVRARFDDEARLIAALDHPHIVPVFDYVERDGLCLMVMERLTGGTVWDRFQASELDPRASCATVLAACAGLHHAHQRGVLHRDVKPQNLMFTGDGVLKVTDFGIAEVVGGSATLATLEGEIFGTPAYMAPEQAQGEVLGPATDVYSVATVLYQLLSGELPFPGEGQPVAVLYRHVHQAPEPLLRVAPEVPPRIADVTMRALRSDPTLRFDSAEAFGVALAHAANASWGPGWIRATGVGVAAVGPILAAVIGDRPAPEAGDAVASGSALTGPQATIGDAEGDDRPFWPPSAPPPSAPRPVDVPRRLIVLGGAALVVAAGGAALGVARLAAPGAAPPQPRGRPSAGQAPGAAPARAAPAPRIQWRALRSAPTARAAVAAAVADGRIWVLGGLEDGRASVRVEGYDPAINAWTTGPDLPFAVHHAMAATYRGELVVLGGWRPRGDDLTAIASDQVLALRDGRWVELPSLGRARAAGAVAVAADRLVVASGQADDRLLAETEVFDGDAWADAADLPTPREHAAAAADARHVYVVGGRVLSASRNLAALERYDPAADTWRTLPALPTPRGGLAAAIVDGHLVAAGGELPDRVLDTVEAYDLAAASWVRLPGLTVARHGLSAAAVGSSLYAVDGARRTGHAAPTAAIEALDVPRALR